MFLMYLTRSQYPGSDAWNPPRTETLEVCDSCQRDSPSETRRASVALCDPRQSAGWAYVLEPTTMLGFLHIQRLYCPECLRVRRSTSGTPEEISVR